MSRYPNWFCLFSLFFNYNFDMHFSKNGLNLALKRRQFPDTLFVVSYGGVPFISICCTHKRPLCLQKSRTKDTKLKKYRGLRNTLNVLH